MTDLPVNTVLCGDCLEVMREWPDGCVGLVLTDPPYGKNCDSGTNGFGHAANRRYAGGWDSKPIDTRHISLMQRVAKEQIIFGGNYFPLPLSNCWLVWDKVGETVFKNPFADCELIWTSFSAVVRKYVVRQQGFVRDSRDEVVHPTQKPIGLMIAILRDWTNPGDLILDPFCGSGTTCVAAKMLGRNFIGIDISPEYCEIARARLKAVDTGVPAREARNGQMALFQEKP